MDSRITALIFVGIGFILCMYGYKIQKLVITLAWFCIGYTIAGYIGGNFIEAANTLLIIQIVAGLVLASMGYKLEKLALCLAVAYLTYTTIGPYITGFESTMSFAIQIGISLLVGILSILFIKPILICITSIAGATLVKQYVPVFITLQSNILFIGFIVLAVCGILIQLKQK